MKPITDLHDLLINELKILYAIEVEELNELSQFIFKVKNEELKLILQSRKDYTKIQIIRLEEALILLGERPSQIKESKFLKIHFEETKNILKIITELSVVEVQIILCFQTISHIEIASYGTLLSFAKTMNMNEVASLLEKSLNEEKKSDLQLTILGEYKINEDARVETFISLGYIF